MRGSAPRRAAALTALALAAACGWPLGMRPVRRADASVVDARDAARLDASDGAPLDARADEPVDARDVGPPPVDALADSDTSRDTGCVPRCATLNPCGSDGCGGSCGTCGVTQECAGGRCVCPAGTMECGGRCVSIDNDPLHCGACDNDCRAGGHILRASCIARSCRIVQCDAEYADCDGSVMTGCEAAVGAYDSCGTCGSVRMCTGPQLCVSAGLGPPYRCCVRATAVDGGYVCLDMRPTTLIGAAHWCCD